MVELEEGPSAEELKNQGNDALKKGDIYEAIEKYTESLGMCLFLFHIINKIWFVELVKNEGVYTNRAMAYIKLTKWKEALFDCEQALVVNPQFSKGHLRAASCYKNQGMLDKAKVALEMAQLLGDESAKTQLPFISELFKMDEYAVKATTNKNFREALSYLRKILESCPNSVRHLCLLLENMVEDSPNDL